jgi:O-6-methylguanine DNA methyltransferase
MQRTGIAMAVGHRVAWDVPVILVAAADAAGSPDTADRQLHRVALDPALPGIAALDVTTVSIGDLRLIERVMPVIGVDGSETRPSAGFSDLLADLRADLGAVAGAVAGDAPAPVLVTATPFARSVLAALLHVPAGAACTYAGLAAAAGRPRAVRAVASVMARNRVPLVLPCHRVVPSGGGVGRYAWGAEVKSALLTAESAAASSGAAA